MNLEQNKIYKVRSYWNWGFLSGTDALWRLQQNFTDPELDCTTTVSAATPQRTKPMRHTLLEIAVSYQTLSNQILKISSQFHIMIRHNDRT